MKIKDLSLADLYALYWHFAEIIPDPNSVDYEKDPDIILEACRKELDRRVTLLHNSIKENENSD